MKVIINQPRSSYFVGGAEMISFDHAINLMKLGVDVYFFTINPKSIGLEYSLQFKKFSNNFKDKINIIEINQDPRIKYIYDITPGEDRIRWNVESIYYNQRLYEYLCSKNEKYDVIFSYYNLDSVFIPRNLIDKNVLYLCGIPKEQNDFQGSFLSCYDKILAISKEVKDSWKKYSKDEVDIVSTGVDCDRFGLKNYENNNSITLLYVGRLILRKNVDKIINAYDKLKRKYDIKLIIVGDGPDRNRLESISNNVEFTGVVDNPEIYYKKSDIFVSPSEYGEGLQGSILEAMSSGLIVVATNTKINKELLKDERGFLVESDIDSILEGITKAIESDGIKIGNNSRAFVVDNYSWINKTEDILNILS